MSTEYLCLMILHCTKENIGVCAGKERHAQ